MLIIVTMLWTVAADAGEPLPLPPVQQPSQENKEFGIPLPPFSQFENASIEDVLVLSSRVIETANNTMNHTNLVVTIGVAIVAIIISITGLFIQVSGKKKREYYLAEIAKCFKNNHEVRAIFIHEILMDEDFKELIGIAISQIAREEVIRALEDGRTKVVKEKIRKGV